MHHLRSTDVTTAFRTVALSSLLVTACVATGRAQPFPNEDASIGGAGRSSPSYFSEGTEPGVCVESMVALCYHAQRSVEISAICDASDGPGRTVADGPSRSGADDLATPRALRFSATPNPFGAVVRFATERGTPFEDPITVQILSVDGRLLRVLRFASGTVAFWDGRDARGDELPGGSYLAVVRTARAETAPAVRRIVKVG